jgi:leucyl-tRNA synthetase
MHDLAKYQKKVMPFVQMIKERIEAVGAEQALQLTCQFSEVDVLSRNIEYITNSLELEGITIKPAQESKDDKVKEECCPGKPLISFEVAPSVTIRILNHQPLSGHFSWNISIMNGDSLNRMRLRMQKEKYIKDATKVSIYRYINPEQDTRKFPTLDMLSSGRLALINDTDTFSIDVAKNQVFVHSVADGKPVKYEIGDQLAYFVNTD